MTKIEIDNLDDLIKKNYPIEYIKKIIDEVLSVSMPVKNDYPDYRQWFLSKQVPGIYDGSRNIIVAHISGQMVGFVSLKKDDIEKKICTFYITKSFRKNKIGTTLAAKSIEWLEYEKPLITIPADKLGSFLRISKKYNWEMTDIKDGLYRTNNPEIILNGSIAVNNLEIVQEKAKTKSLSNIYFFYKLHQFKNSLFLYNLIFKKAR